MEEFRWYWLIYSITRKSTLVEKNMFAKEDKIFTAVFQSIYGRFLKRITHYIIVKKDKMQ